jgi:hypothetical protein
MNATIKSTDVMVNSVPTPRGLVNVPARVWEGVTEGGVAFTAYITCVQVRRDADNSQFVDELSEHKHASDATQRAIDMRHVI